MKSKNSPPQKTLWVIEVTHSFGVALLWGVSLAAFLFVFAFVSPAAFAGEMNFTVQDAARQAAFIKEMDGAAAAATRGDRKQAQKGLKRALLASGYGIAVLPDSGGCGRPAFSVPLWLLSAQAEMGDIAGAKETARRLGSAQTTLEAFHFIAQTQNVRPSRKEFPYIFSEAIPRKVPDLEDDRLSQTEFDYRKHDYSALKQLRLAPNPALQSVILREALPYAIAQSRANAKYCTSLSNLFDADAPLQNLAVWQDEIGDSAGIQRTVAALRTPARRALSLLVVAEAQRAQNDSRFAATEAVAVNQIPQIDRGDSRERAAFYLRGANRHLWRKDIEGARMACADAIMAVRSLTNIFQRLEGLWLVVNTLDFSTWEGPNYILHRTEQDKRMQKTLLCEIRDLTLQSSDADLIGPSLEARKFLAVKPKALFRIIALVSVAASLANQAQDKAEALATLKMARVVAERETDALQREKLLNIVERNEERLSAERTRG